MRKSDLKVSFKKLIWPFEILLFCLFPFGIQAESTNNFQPPIEQIRGTIIKRTHYPNQYFEINPDTGEYKNFVYIGDQKIAEINERGEINYYVNDHLGSETMVLDQRGNVIEQKDYLPYGKINSNESHVDNDYGFVGKELDNETDLNYLEQRYYDSNLGKFITVDPLLTMPPKDILSDPQQLNSYSYGRGNPLRFVDKTGEKVWEFQPYYSAKGFYDYKESYGKYRGLDVVSAGKFSGESWHDYQCVDWAKTFIRSQFDPSFGSIGNAKYYGQQSAYEKYNNSHLGQFKVYENKGSMMPQENDIISWSGSNTGHVGIISEVVFDDKSGTGHVYTIEQNWSGKQGLYSQELRRSFNNQGQAIYTVSGRGNYSVQGWTRYQNQSIYSGFTPRYTSILHTPAPRNYIYNN